MAEGAGVSQATGLAGITNGDVIRQGTANLSRGPYLARLIVRYFVPLGPSRDTLARGIDQVRGLEPSARLDFKAGKLAASDDFDQNRYANSTRTQFMNWGLFNNTAWDFAADTRGYTWGTVLAWVEPRWILRLGTFAMPTMANGNVFDSSFPHARGDNVELPIRPGSRGTVIRALVYENRARMGSYAEALARASTTGGIPDIVNEDFVFTEADRHLSGGLQLAGVHWRRAADRVGIAYVLHGLSSDHRAYLAAGGQGSCWETGGCGTDRKASSKGITAPRWVPMWRPVRTFNGSTTRDITATVGRRPWSRSGSTYATDAVGPDRPTPASGSQIARLASPAAPHRGARSYRPG
ncbi:MAG: hypothetical protein DMD33_16595 [Gemmatimonadetes bacterium]|nr:MAG: hypothetical protein DMD33_16595 [Gemmatimonadota bacterium]PYO78124.1 MAG: hypothetical protein DMD67_05480 [Gemmatimonadota bacterium]TLY54821.1 MAG: carbohydrate porin [Gemmatimonadota bacterium]